MDGPFPRQRLLSLSLALAAAYFALACGSLQLIDGADGAATIWPAAGLALGALILSPPRAWPGFCVAIFVANLAAQLLVRDATLPLSLLIAVGGVVQSLLAALAMGSIVRGPRPQIGSLNTVLGLFAGAIVGGGVAALGSGTALSVNTGASSVTATLGWWLGNAVGMLVVTPVMLALSEPGRHDGRRGEAAALVGVTGALAFVLFWHDPDSWPAVLSLGLPIVPLLMWCAIRAGARATTFASALVAAVAGIATARGMGPFASAAFSTHERAQVLQAFLAIVVLSTLLVGAVVADQRRAQADARRAAADLRTVFERAPIGHAIVDGDGALLESNQALTAITGYDLRELRDRSDTFVHRDDVGPLRALVAATACGESSSAAMEVRATHRDGHRLHLSLHLAVLGEQPTAPGRVLIQLVDITGRKALESQLRELADHDPLTGLLNRRRFDQELAAHLARTRRYGAEGAVLMMDLDGFKAVNDTLGHQAGDELLADVAHHLAHRLRTSDVLARLGGDEFVSLLPHVDRSAAAEVADSLVAVIRTELDVTISVGIAMVVEAVTPIQLLQAADRAMYVAKADGRDRYAFAGPD